MEGVSQIIHLFLLIVAVLVVGGQLATDVVRFAIDRILDDVIEVDVEVGSVMASDLEVNLKPAAFAASSCARGLGGIVGDANVSN